MHRKKHTAAADPQSLDLSGQKHMPDDERNVEIRIDRIPVGTGVGAAVAIVVLLGAMLVEVSALRLPALAGAAGGYRPRSRARCLAPPEA